MESWGNHIAIVVEGILKQPNNEAPIISGLLLYKSLVKTHRISLIFDGAGKNIIHHWLLKNGIVEHTGEIYVETTDPTEIGPRRIAQVQRLTRNGPLAMVIESDVEAAVSLLEKQIPTLLYLHPSFTHHEHRPDYKGSPKPWNDVVDELKRQQEARILADALESKEENYGRT